MPQPPSAPPEVFDADTITINSEPPPYTERDRTLSLSSNEIIEERKRRKRQKNARLKMRCFKCLAIFLACVISSISIAGILHSAVLNISLEHTNENLKELEINFRNQEDELHKILKGFQEMSQKLNIVEQDLESIKGVQKDIQFIHEVREQMKSLGADTLASIKSGTLGNSKSKTLIFFFYIW